MEEFPSNSHKSRMTPKPESAVPAAPAETKEKAEQVVEGKVRKRSHLSRFKEAMFGEENLKSVMENVLYEVMIPAAKDLVVDSLMETVSRKFGTNAGRRIARSVAAHSGPVAYNRFSQTTTRESARVPGIVRARRGSYEVEEIAFDSRPQAASVLEEMRARIARYGACSVMDYYDLVGQTGNHVDEKWGWVNLSSVGVSSVGREGYMINLPDALSLD